MLYLENSYGVDNEEIPNVLLWIVLTPKRSHPF